MNNRKILKYHSWFGLIGGLFILLMGLSGAILVFQHDIDDALWKEYIHIEHYETLDLDKGFASIQQKYPKWDTRLMHFKENEALIFNLRKPTERLFVFVHPSTGEIIKELNELTTFTRWLLKFHYSYQAGPAGRILVFLVGLLFLLSILTGIYLYRKSILKTFIFQTKIIHKNKRSFYSSLHRIIGVWSLLLNMLLVITGLFLAYKVAMSGLNPPKAANTPIVTAPINKTLEEIRTTYPDFETTYIRLPSNPEGSVLFYGLYKDDPFYYSEFYNNFQADYQTGEITGITKNSEAELITKFYSSLIPLHFGQFGGIWTKLLYCFIGLSGPFLSVTGFFIWQKSRKKKRKTTFRK
jgi:uncharacterized iron-regulated membrane protein